MRTALSKKTSTKAERIIAEILKRNRIPFQHRQKVSGREVDFIIGKYAIEVDGHPQSSVRNDWLIGEGYIPLHFTNRIVQTDPRGVEESLIPKLMKMYE